MLFISITESTRKLSYRKDDQCAQYMGTLKNYQSPDCAHGYFSRNL